MLQFPFTLGQSVRHIDRDEIGVVIGVLFSGGGRAIVRWADNTTLEVVETLVGLKRRP
jgi:hypothetical protein